MRDIAGESVVMVVVACWPLGHVPKASIVHVARPETSRPRGPIARPGGGPYSTTRTLLLALCPNSSGMYIASAWIGGSWNSPIVVARAV